MTVLGIDTATAVATVGIVRAGRILAEVSRWSDHKHAECLPELTAQVLSEAGLGIAAVEGIAISLGPGSFTGLRVGLSFAKGVALANHSRMVGIGTLEALASVVREDSARVAVALDARRGEVYLAVFRKTPQSFERVTDDLALDPAGAVERALGAHASLVVGDAAERYPQEFETLRSRGARILPFRECHPQGSEIALRGERLLQHERTAAGEALVPIYVRSSAAERNAQRATLTTETSVS